MRVLLALVLCAGVAHAEVRVDQLAAQPALTRTIKAKPAQLAAAMQKAILSPVLTS